MEELYPPGTRLERLNDSTKVLQGGTVMDVPLTPAATADKQCDMKYTVLFDDGTSASVPLSQMADLIPKPPMGLEDNLDGSGLPPFFQEGSKITYEHVGTYVKGYLKNVNGVYRFSYKSHPNKRSEEWGVNLPNLRHTWAQLCTESILVPGHSAHSFIRNSASSTTCDVFANFVSAINLHKDYPASLIRALADTITVTVRYGFRVIMRRRTASRVWERLFV